MYSKEATRIENNYRIYSELTDELKCWECGDIFRCRSPKARYCSQRCANDAAIKRRKARIDSKRSGHTQCVICGKPVNQANAKIRIYCGKACKQKAYRQNSKKGYQGGNK